MPNPQEVWVKYSFVYSLEVYSSCLRRRIICNENMNVQVHNSFRKLMLHSQSIQKKESLKKYIHIILYHASYRLLSLIEDSYFHLEKEEVQICFLFEAYIHVKICEAARHSDADKATLPFSSMVTNLSHQLQNTDYSAGTGVRVLPDGGTNDLVPRFNLSPIKLIKDAAYSAKSRQLKLWKVRSAVESILSSCLKDKNYIPSHLINQLYPKKRSTPATT